MSRKYRRAEKRQGREREGEPCCSHAHRTTVESLCFPIFPFPCACGADHCCFPRQVFFFKFIYFQVLWGLGFIHLLLSYTILKGYTQVNPHIPWSPLVSKRKTF